MTDDPRRHSPAAQRNRAPILAELQRLLLEIASGTGEHAAHFSAGLSGWQWQPSDAEAAALPSIVAWCAGLERVRAPLRLDVLSADWPGAPRPVDAIFCANLIHIAPWACCVALMRGAAHQCHAAGPGRDVDEVGAEDRVDRPRRAGPVRGQHVEPQWRANTLQAGTPGDDRRQGRRLGVARLPLPAGQP